MNKFDLGILLIVLIFMAFGYYKGLIKSILNVVQYFVVTIFSITLAPMVSKFLIGNFNLDLVIVEWVKNNENLFFDALSLISEEVLKNISGRIINILSVFLLFIVFKLICSLIINILNKISELPIICVANKFGGLILGAVNGILVVYLLILLINWLPLEALNFIREEMNLSFLGNAINLFVPEVATEVISMVKTSI